MAYLNINTKKTSKSKRGGFNPFNAIHKTSRDFKGDKSGVAAIEFAFIAPIMITIYFGLAEVASAIGVDRRISHTASVMGDLATQTADLPNVAVEEVFAASLRVLDINDLNNVTMELSSYEMDNQNPPQPRLIGTATFNAGQTLPPFDPLNVDPRILNETSGVVVARIAYSYTPLKLRFTDANIELNETFLLKPRKSTRVPIGSNPDIPVNCSGTNLANLTCS